VSGLAVASFAVISALAGPVACGRHDTGTAQSPAASSGEGVKKPPAVDRRGAEYRSRLFAAFAACGQHDLGNLDGHWMAVGSKLKDVWICDGTIRFRQEWGGLSDVCISSIRRRSDGIDAEAAYHEDIDDPGDASGAYLYFSHRGDHVAIEMEFWDEPGTRSDFLVLERKREPSDAPNMKCPPGFLQKPLPSPF
jgi:hypothetical protein